MSRSSGPLPERLLQKLACPECRRPLQPEAAASPMLRCTGCSRRYPIAGDVPLLFPGERPTEWAQAQAALYDGIAPHYDESIPAHVAAHYRRKRVDLVASLAAPGAAVLDVGCGTGTLAAALRDRGFDVYGVDASSGMLGELGRAGRGWPVGGFSERLPFAGAAFDLAITAATLHHVSEAQRVADTIAEMCRVVRRGGCVVLWDHNPSNPYWPLLMKRIPQDTGDERLVPLAELKADLALAGVTQVEAHRSGLVPDFTPPALLAAAAALEWVVERTPLLNVFCAHNVVVGYVPDVVGR